MAAAAPRGAALSGLGGFADARARRRGDRRTSPPPSPRDASRGPSRRRAVRGAGRHRAAGPERRCRACGRTRSPRAGAPTARAEARRAGQARRSPATRAPRPMPQRRTSPARRPGPACPSPPDRVSAPPRAPGTPQPPQRPHGPAPGRPSAPARRPPPRRHPPPREHDATPGDRDRYPDRSPPPTPDAQLAARRGPPPGTPRIAPVDAGSGHGLRPRRAARLLPGRASSFRCRAPEPRARRASRHRPARPRPAAAVAGSPRAAHRRAGGSAPRGGAGGLSQGEARSRPPAPLRSCSAADRAERAGCRGFPRRCGRGRGRRADPERLCTSRVRASSSASPRSSSSGRPSKSCPVFGSRTATTIATDSASSRRAMKPRISPEASSSH